MKRLFLILLYFVMIYVAAYGSNENTIVFGQHEQVTGEDYNEKEKINMENNIIQVSQVLK